MKLLFCPECSDVFKLESEHRQCKCGKVSGHYINQQDAVTNGQGISLAIGNGSLVNAIGILNGLGDNHYRHEYIKESPVLCWVRPNDGIGNPHTKVVNREEKGVECLA